MQKIFLFFISALIIATSQARYCEETADCDPLFICVEQECICRFGRMPCTPPLFGFAPLNALPRFHRDISAPAYNLS